jgi:hypothetical protein
MTDYLDLERRFGLLTKYSVEELLALDIMGRRHLGWEQLLTGRFSIITARANFRQNYGTASLHPPSS